MCDCSRLVARLKWCVMKKRDNTRGQDELSPSPWEQDYRLADMGQMGLFNEYLEMSL